MVITSAGCNALDYLLADCGEVNAVDVNPIQNALLELKTAACRTLDYDSFYSLFGKGRSPYARQMYFDSIRPALSAPARRYWDKHIGFFLGKGWRKSFYFRGTSGLLAKLFLVNAHVAHRLRDPIEELLEARSVEEQSEIYHSKIRQRIWTPWLKWFLSQSLTLSLLGVPWPQRDEITTQYPGGVGQFIRDALEAVVTRAAVPRQLFLARLLPGPLRPGLLPGVRPQGELRAAAGAGASAQDPHLHRDRFPAAHGAGRVAVRAAGPHGLDELPQPQGGLVDEWNAILDKARPGARVIFRSAGLKVSYLDHLRVAPPRPGGGTRRAAPLQSHLRGGAARARTASTPTAASTSRICRIDTGELPA